MFASRLVRQLVSSRSSVLIARRGFSTQPTEVTPQQLQKQQQDLVSLTSTQNFKNLIATTKHYYEILSEAIGESNVTPLAKAESIQPNLSISTPAGKLAHALFTSAAQMRCINIVSKEVEKLLNFINIGSTFEDSLKSKFSNEEKTTIISLLANSCTGLSPLTSFFLYHIAFIEKFELLVPALKDFKKLADSLSTDVTVKLTVAHNYSAAEKAELEKEVTSFFVAGTPIKYNYTVDESIINGFKIESTLLNHDATLKSAEEKAKRDVSALVESLKKDIEQAIKDENPVWETKEFQDKYFL